MARRSQGHQPVACLLALLLLLLLSISAAEAFSATATNPSRLALLRDLQSAAASTTSTPFSHTIKTAILDGNHKPLTRTELELLLPRDRAPLRALEEAEGKQQQHKQKNLALGLSLRAYESAVAENHKDVGATLERWRRVVALRQNRVLVPGRAAELYSQLISTLLWADEFELAQQVLQYVGLTPQGVYLPSAATPLTCDLNHACFKIGKQMLDIPLEKKEWELEGRARGLPEPLSPREQGEAIAEWCWQQVPPEGGDPELEHYVVDMTLAVLRMALREAKARGESSLALRLQAVADPAAPAWGMGTRGVLVPRDSLEFLRDTDAAAVGVKVEVEEP